jgi:hypothetical protein
MAKAHDVDICFCGDVSLSVAESDEAADTYIPCPCPCAECDKNRERVRRLVGVGQLMRRLLGASVDPEVLADMMWMLLEPTIEAKVAALVEAQLKEQLRGKKLFTTIEM